MRRIFLSLICFTLCGAYAPAQTRCRVIPLPDSYTARAGHFSLHPQTPIVIPDSTLLPLASYLQNALLQSCGLLLPVKLHTHAAGIRLQYKTSSANPEAYTLNSNPRGVTITASQREGLFYGIISLLQLTGSRQEVPACRITDVPRYAWRGLMLDESRYFFGKQKVKALLDQMAYYKLNRFHWHLTDVPGWRLEIKQYPLLTTVGGKGNYGNPDAPAAYYTQDDIREIVTYAAARCITIIPEIDMPGHATAANRAYPAFDGGGTEKYPSFTFHPGREGTYQYLADILRETAALFPAKIIHLGGDEVSFGNSAWDRDTAVAQLMRVHQLHDRKAVEAYFIQRMADTVIQHGAQVMAWDEAAAANLPPDRTIICWWRHDKPEQLQLALQRNYRVVICPRLPLYFDFVQDSSHRIGRRWKKEGFNPLEKVYQFNPGNNRLILGIQACLWTETISDNRRLDFMLFPRIAALSEAAWSNAPRNYTGFLERLRPHLAGYRQQGIYYYDPFQPALHTETGKAVDDKKFMD